MRGSLIRTALRLGHEVIGQVRRDTALFALPPPRQPGRRGRSRLYGARLDADTVAALPASVHAIAGYGGRSARLRHAVCRPRFLKGVIVRVVWCELAKGSGWAKVRLLLSTDPTLSAPAIVEAYSKRWSIEPLFRDLKMVDGLGAMWQRGACQRRMKFRQLGRSKIPQFGRAVISRQGDRNSCLWAGDRGAGRKAAGVRAV